MAGDEDAPTTGTRFSAAPLINSRYAYPSRPWELDGPSTDHQRDDPIPVINKLAPADKRGQAFPEHFGSANQEANPSLARLALKLATGAGKTTVMAMLIAWQTINAVRKKDRGSCFTRGFLVITQSLTEGWDANTVTNVLGTQLLFEQVIGRAQRRQSYELNEEGKFDVEYADVLGIPFDFNAKPIVAAPQPPRETVRVHAVRPERGALGIRLPRVEGYRIGERVDLNLVHAGDVRPSKALYELTAHLVMTRWRDEDGVPRLSHFGQLKRIARQWLDEHLVCTGGTYPAQLMYKTLADMACERIVAAINRAGIQKAPAVALRSRLRSTCNPVGSTSHVNDQWTTFIESLCCNQEIWQT